VLTLLGLVLVLLLGTPAFRAELTPQGLSFSAEAQNQNLTLRAGGLWTPQGFSPQFSFTWAPRVPTATISFTTDSLAAILVQPGQVLHPGNLIGYARLGAMERIATLERALAETEDELLQAEISEEIARLREENEIRALIPGKVRSLTVEQAGRTLKVQILVEVRKS